VVSAERISSSLFAGDEGSLQRQDLQQLRQDGLPSISVKPGDGLLSTMVALGAAKSSGEARKLVQGKGVRLNGQQVVDPKLTIVFDDAYFGEYFLLRKGKKQHYLLVKS
jgi:tyrosyl-tRNA synthetase